jgi:hypothetical protein
MSFQPGVSGSPKGRAVGSQNRQSKLSLELFRKLEARGDLSQVGPDGGPARLIVQWGSPVPENPTIDVTPEAENAHVEHG